MLKELIKVANSLDAKGFYKEADALDEIINNLGDFSDLDDTNITKDEAFQAGTVVCDTELQEETSCCPECHFEFEEEEAVPFLSDKIKKRLLKEHKELEEKGFPEKEMLAHSKRELKWFEEANVPSEILTKIKKDHAILLGKKDSYQCSPRYLQGVE